MRAASVTYTPGPWLAVIGAQIWALIDVRVEDPRVRALWQAATEQGADELLDVLLHDGLRTLPGFVIVAQEQDRLRYAVRHPGVLELHDPDGARSVDGGGVDSWAGGRLNEPGDLVMVLRAEAVVGGVELPTAAGVTSASMLRLDFGGSELAVANSKPEVENEALETAVRVATPEDAMTDAGNATAAAAAGEPETEPELAEPDPAEPEPAEPEPEAATPDSQASTYFQLLNSSTMDRDVLLSKLRGEDDPSATGPPARAEGNAAVAAERPGTSDATSVWTAGLEEEPTLPVPDSAPVPPAVSTGNGMIDGLPWANAPSPPATAAAATTEVVPVAPLPGFRPLSPPSPPISAVTPPPPVEADPSGGVSDQLSVTINRAALRRQLEEDNASGPMLLALRCRLGHLSPTYAATCRVCGAELGHQSPIEVMRPSLGQLVLSNGSVVVLDRGVIFGRSPHSEVEDPAHRPNLVRLIDSAEISRMHASVALDGWQVLLRDLASQNGTLLTLPGKAPEQIRPNEDYILEPGSVISFADVVSATFQVSA